jgi:hypothetical protein
MLILGFGSLPVCGGNLSPGNPDNKFPKFGG